MATNHTTNYQLNLWEPADAFVRSEFNENSSKIDAALGNHDRTFAEVDKSIAAVNTAIAQRDAAIAQRLRCLAGSYTGDDSYTRTINFGVEPKLVVLTCTDLSTPTFTVLIRGQSKGGMASSGTSENNGFDVSWSGTSVTLSRVTQYIAGPFNSSGRKYSWIVFY